MACEIRWTDNAVEDLEHLVSYLRNEWSEQSAQTFLAKLWRKLEIVKHQPLIGQQSAKLAEVRRILITKHTSIFYSVRDDVITILDVFDNRQHPNRSIF